MKQAAPAQHESAGRAPYRLTGKAPFGRRNITTIVAALRRAHCPMIIDRAMIGAIFLDYVRRLLLPHWRQPRGCDRWAW
jgi:hypothetical protein